MITTGRLFLSEAPFQFAVLAIALVMGVDSCSSRTPLTRSELAGAWSLSEGTRRFTEPTGQSRKEEVVTRSHLPDVVIREDGSFDWMRTMMTMHGPVDRLRNKGDRIKDAQDPHAVVEVVSSEYTPRMSSVVLTRRVSGRAVGTMTFQARIEDDKTVSYSEEASHDDGKQELRAKLVRYGTPIEAPGEQRRLVSHRGEVLCVCFSPSGESLLSCAEDGCVILWDTARGSEIRRYAKQGFRARTAAFSPDGKTVAIGGDLGPDRARIGDTIVLWDVAEGRETLTVEGFRSVHAIRFSPDGRYVWASGSYDRLRDTSLPADWALASLRSWDATTGIAAGNLRLDGQKVPTYSFAFLPDGHHVLAVLYLAGEAPRLALWSLDGDGQVRRFGDGIRGVIECLALSPDASQAACGGVDGYVRLWEVGTGRELHRMTTGAQVVWDVAFSPDGRWLVSGDSSGQLIVWSTKDFKEARRWIAHAGGVKRVAFSPSLERRLLASGGSDGIVRLWLSP